MSNHCSGSAAKDALIDVFKVFQYSIPGLAGSDRPSQHDSRGFPVGKGFFCALRYQVALNFGRECKCKCDNLRVDAVSKVEIILNGADMYLPLGALVEYAHDHKHIAPKTGYLGTYQKIPFSHFSDGFPKFPFIRRQGPGHGLTYPTVCRQAIGRQIVSDFEFLT